jgi:iron(II)-dependent oxidoreductase
MFAACALVCLGAVGCNSTPKEIPGMVYVEKGSFMMGYNEGAPNEKPARQATITKSFYVDRYEVTNQQYANFVKATNRTAPKHWKDGAYPKDQDLLPVTNVSLDDARAYASHYGKRLPREDEWEYAARGQESRLFPWGTAWKPEAANNFEQGKNGPVKVGSYPLGKGPYGTYDQAGNVWEWTASEMRPGSGVYIIKGGSFAPLEDKPRASLRGSRPSATTQDNLGFRCVKDPG